MYSGANLTLQYLRRFYDDFAALPAPIASKVTAIRDLVRSHGPYYPSLHTRRVERNPDPRFRFMNVDDQYRIVVALEGNVVLFMRVGNHDRALVSRPRLGCFVELLTRAGCRDVGVVEVSRVDAVVHGTK